MTEISFSNVVIVAAVAFAAPLALGLVLPLSMVDNSAFSPHRLTLPINPVYPSIEGNNPFSSFQGARILMTLYVFLFLLVVFLLLCLARLWHLYWLHHPPHSTAGAIHPMVHRLLKPRTPRDCPACRLASTLPSGVGPAPLPVRPWHEVKSRRGAPKRLNTQGFACPNHQCPYSGITDAHIHALVGDGKHGPASRIQTVRGPACRTTFTARHDTPLYRLKTPSHQIAVVLASRACGLDPSEALRVFGYRQATITSLSDSRGLARPDLARALLLCHLQLPHLQLDERRTRRRSSQQVLWLWLAIDPLTRASSRPPAGSPHAEHGTYGYPLPATDPGRLSASPSSPVTG